ncbi:Hint domain-containing protein [Sphingomonas sp. BIUV-7]|uniref:Hint domain-containing protein n=1 Tax=Sphingomonas natans TaxID=3063330 RepID=A0ABT8Y5P1_9SPHN|nr:Hint domain-containing protein [Sphingomonas sp. BIUV-7]MDO6413647.1 Hint domain-containing protein [Sphingomonas sp. BIUV-7]
MAEYDYPGSSPTYGVTVESGDVMRILSNGYASSITINQGGIQYIQGGDALGVTVNSGGAAQVDSGHASSVTINTGGVVHVDGGRIDNPYINGGTLYVGAGATEAQANVAHGGTEYLGGSTIAATAYDGGRIVLDQPGYQGDTVTTASLTPNYIGLLTINGGGTLEIKNGVTSGLYLQGGNVVIDPVRYDSSVTGSYDRQIGILTIQGSTASYRLHVFDQQNLGFSLSADPSGAVSVAAVQRPVCFLPGTRIATSTGYIAVEAIVPGQFVRTSDGRDRRVVWVGGGHVSGRDTDHPIIVRRGAFGDGAPFADLSVTSGHSFLVDGLLIPIGQLVNGTSIARQREITSYEYFHVQLEQHAILLANGAEAESYRDDGNRRAFAWNAGDLEADNTPFAPIVCDGPSVDSIWQRLAARAGLTWDRLDSDPDLHVIVGGQRIAPSRQHDDTYLFEIEACGEMILASKSVIPAEIGMCRDHRRLGVAIRRYWIEDATSRDMVPFHSSALTNGFYAPEEKDGIRWTDGSAALPAHERQQGRRVTLGVELGCRARYF